MEKSMLFTKSFFTIVFCCTFSSFASAASITVDRDMTIPDVGAGVGNDFSGNATSGIIINSNNGGNAWNVNVVEDLTVNNNSGTNSGIGALISGSKVNFIGTGNDKITLTNNYYGITVGSNSEMTFNSINIDATGNSNQALYVMASGKLTINGSGSTYLLLNGSQNNGLIVGGTTIGGVASIYNTNIEASYGRVGIQSRGGSSVLISGNGTNTFIANNNKNALGTDGKGIASTGANSKINIENMNIETSGNGLYGIDSYLGGLIDIQGNGNNLIVNNNGLYGIKSINTGSKVNITNMNISATGNKLFGIEDGGEINLNNTNVYISDNQNLLEVSNLDSALGTFNATDSSLMGAMSTEAGATSNITLTNTSWANIGKSNISNYVASGVNIYMNTFFGTGDTGDKLTIEESSAGDATLHIRSTGTDGSQSDILVVDQTNATSKNATFDLFGGVVDSGAYEYELHQALDENWYLQSNGNVTNTARTIANMPAIHIDIVKTGMNELNKRLGDIRSNSHKKFNGLWVRSYAKKLNVDEFVDSKMNLFGVEGGYDYNVYQDCHNKLYVGLMIGYLYTDNIRTTQNDGPKGRGNANTPSVGAYVTWFNDLGWFADATVRNFWSNMNVSTKTSQNETISFDADRDFIASSFEFGKRFVFKQDSKSSYLLEPKFEVSYSQASSDDFRTSNGNKINYSETQSFASKLALQTGYQHQFDGGEIVNPFIQFGVIEEWDGKTNIGYAGSEFQSDVSGTSFEIMGGLNAQLTNSFALYSDVAYEKGSVVEAVSGNVGLRYNW